MKWATEGSAYVVRAWADDTPRCEEKLVGEYVAPTLALALASAEAELDSRYNGEMPLIDGPNPAAVSLTVARWRTDGDGRLVE